MALVIAEGPVALAPGVITRSDRPGVTTASDKLQGYVPSSEVAGSVTITPSADIDKLRKMLRDYVDLKPEEIDERREANRYYHAKQWTDDELRVLKERGQPPITYNRIAKKINGVIGLLERLRQDPKAFPRTPAHAEGAEVASQCLRFVLDSCEWESNLSEVVKDLAVAGYGGWELSLDPVDDESMDPVLARVTPESFFYDPRSFEADFSDARYMGVAKWMARDELEAFMPDKLEEISESVTSLSSSTYAEALDPEKENLWWDSELKKLRVSEVWYREGNTWMWSIHTGVAELASGESPFRNSKGASACRYIMQSANVDERGVRYGFIRNLKGPQDEINHRRSKGVHALNTVRVIIEEGRVVDIEDIRREAHRVDGVISLPEGQMGKLRIEANTDVGMANVQMLAEAKEEIESFGPNPALIGQGIDNKSGRAIALIQQAAIAELGPFIVRMRAMKLRTYGLVWEAIRANWKTPRYVRITDDDDVQFLAINQPRMDEFGQQVGMENPIGKVDVDFVLDEGPDTVTLREDAQQALGNALSQAGPALPPPVIIELSRALISNTLLPSADMKRIMDAFDKMQAPQQPDPMQMIGAQAELGKLQADTEDKRAAALLKSEQANEIATSNAMNRVAAEIALTGRAALV